jgi:hypothetical protein
VKGVGR